MPGSDTKANVADRNPETAETLLGATKTKTARGGGDDDDDGRRMEDRRRRKKERREKEASPGRRRWETSADEAAVSSGLSPVYNAKFGL